MNLFQQEFFRNYLLVLCMFLSPFAYGAEDDPDPWEPFNRKVFALNDGLDRAMLKPMAKAYDVIMPDWLDKRLTNVFSNINEVTVIANQLLQFKFKEATSDSGRLLINTTLGLGGMFDVAAKMGLEKHDEDFGQTLGAWGFDSGNYLVLPLFGPSSIRDGIGLIPNNYLDPLTHIDHVPTRNSVTATDIVVSRADLMDKEKLISGDRYLFIRDAYLQRRAYLVADGQIDDDEEDDFEDYEDYED